MSIDLHAHYYPPEYVTAVGGIKDEPGEHGDVARFFLRHPLVSAVPAFTGDLEGRVRLLDEAGIDEQYLSFASMNIWHPDAATRAQLAYAFNLGCSRACVEFAPRFRFLATLPFPHVAESVDAARQVRGMPGFAGYSLPTRIDGRSIDDPHWDPVYSAMAEDDAVVLVHPDGFSAPGVLDDYSMEWAIGAPFEDSIATIRLIRSGLRDRYQKLSWVIPHLGGTVPFLWHRIVWRWELEGLAASSDRDLSGLIFDCANSSADTLALAGRVLPRGSIALGTDYPFVSASGLGMSARLFASLGGESQGPLTHTSLDSSVDRRDSP